MTDNLKYRIALAIPFFVAVAAACASDPKIIVPNDYHGPVHIAFCNSRTANAPILINDKGQGNSSLCERSLTKFAVKRASGESLPAPSMQLVTTGDGIVVGADFTIP